MSQFLGQGEKQFTQMLVVHKLSDVSWMYLNYKASDTTFRLPGFLLGVEPVLFARVYGACPDEQLVSRAGMTACNKV